MLCLSRYAGQSFTMTKGEQRIKVTVQEVRQQRSGGLQVRLAIEAPRDVLILRQEVADRSK